MKKFFYLTAFFLAIFLNLSAKIVETGHFNEITQYVTPDTLVILDIDDTLLIPAQALGTDVWFRERLKHYQDQEEKPLIALDKALAEWEAVRQLTRVVLVEKGTDEVVKSLQKNHTVVMGLTTQGLALATCTINQLASLNIDLSLTAPYKDDYYFMNRLGVLYRQGILFTSGTDKGVALLKFLDAAGFCPKHIVFINDKEAHLKDVEKSVIERKIDYDGLRYSYSDQRVNTYDKQIANIQWERSSFGKILSDEEAKALIQKTE